jgi:hypothetical protein
MFDQKYLSKNIPKENVKKEKQISYYDKYKSNKQMKMKKFVKNNLIEKKLVYESVDEISQSICESIIVNQKSKRGFNYS